MLKYGNLKTVMMENDKNENFKLNRKRKHGKGLRERTIAKKQAGQPITTSVQGGNIRARWKQGNK